MTIREVTGERERYWELLLLADEQESMVRRYLYRGTMYALEGDVGVCVVTREGESVLELKNLAIAPEFQRRGLGRAMVDFLVQRYRGRYKVLQVGTGDSPLTIPFYESCGFRRSHVVKNFFLDHYDHPIFEGGVQLTDMIYLQKSLE